MAEFGVWGTIKFYTNIGEIPEKTVIFVLY